MSFRTLTYEATPESKQQTSYHEHHLAYSCFAMMYFVFAGPKNNTLLCIGIAFSFLSYAIKVKNRFKENSKASKTAEEATKENKNDVAHEMNSTWFDHDVIHFCPSCGAAETVSHDRTKVNRPIKLGSRLH